MTWEGRGLTFDVRDGTTDWNTVEAAVGQDEYDLADEDLDGKLVFDVGAHIGSVGIWAASRGATAVCIEPIPENVSAIVRNRQLNGLCDHVKVVDGAAGREGEQFTVHYGYSHDETAVGHRFIGNGQSGAGEHKSWTVYACSLAMMVASFGRPDVVKLDCEGGEWAWLGEPAIRDVPLVVGEWHPIDGETRDDVLDALGPTHHVSFSGPEAGPGGFRAWHRED